MEQGLFLRIVTQLSVIWMINVFWLGLWYVLLANSSMFIFWDRTLDQSPFLQALFFLLLIFGMLVIIKRLAHIRLVKLTPFLLSSSKEVKIGPLLLLTSHHPTHNDLESHELSIGNLRVCSGCYGSITGIFLGSFLIVVVFLVENLVDQNNFGIIYLLGIIFMQLALGKYIIAETFREPAGYFRFFLNASFPIGIIIIIISVYSAQESVLLALVTLLVLLIPVGSRLLLARLEHNHLDSIRHQ